MAFKKDGLLSYGTGGALNATTRRTKLWHYISDDALATIAASGYFNDVASQLQKGDIITVTGVASGTVVVQTYVVAGIAAGVVTTSIQA